MKQFAASFTQITQGCICVVGFRTLALLCCFLLTTTFVVYYGPSNQTPAHISIQRYLGETIDESERLAQEISQSTQTHISNQIKHAVVLASKYSIDRRLLLGDAAAVQNEEFVFNITKVGQKPDTEDEFYIKVVSENTRQVASVQAFEQLCENRTIVDRENGALTPQNPKVGENPVGPRQVMYCKRDYRVSFIPAEGGEHKIVLRVFLEDVPVAIYGQWCNGCPEVNPYYCKREQGSLVEFNIDVAHSENQTSLSGKTMPTCNYTGLREGVWLRKNNTATTTGYFLSGSGTSNTTTTQGDFWTDEYLWVPQRGGLCRPSSVKRQPPQEQVASTLHEKNISKILIAGDSITREFYFDIATFFTPKNSTFAWTSESKQSDHKPTSPMIPNAPQLEYMFHGDSCPGRTSFNRTNSASGTCFGADVLVINHGLWSVYRFTPGDTFSSIERCILQLAASECKDVIAKGRAYYLSMPATSGTPFLRIPERVRRFNSEIGNLAGKYGIKAIDTYHWAQARPEGSEDGTHFGAWGQGPMFLSRTTVDLFLADLLS
eukprot:comp5203_c0_seq1/m.1244 comp5203_c0_seq1/g.1244  ORF comp5203_c0_seq1/g.1244 comp5203_c0_seq1/m.1244 type:complete len:547 (-) comp5203_c0_seq1:256-1896(-)